MEKINADDVTLKGVDAMRWAKELSKLPNVGFTVVSFPYSRLRNKAVPKLEIKEHSKWRTQLPKERFSVDGENLFLFSDEHGEPKMCYKILIRYMAFPNDGYKLHKIDWL